MPLLSGMGASGSRVRSNIGPGYRFEWDGDIILSTLLEASRRAINEVNRQATQLAREHPMWENDTGQTEAAIYIKDADVEFHPHGHMAGPHVWGEWGVEDRPRWVKEEGDAGSVFAPSAKYREQYRRTYGSDELAQSKALTTMDVAMFLEFGTVRMAARPWLYPAWDQTKHLLPLYVKTYYEEILASGAPRALRTTGGRFAPYLHLLG